MNEHSHVRIESPAFASESVHLLELSGREAISQLFEFHAQVASSDPAGLDVDALIGAPAVLVFERGGAETRRMGGLIAGIRDSMHEETGKMVYDLWFAPRAFRLGLVETYEIFMDLSVPDIVKKKLERAGLLEDQDYELRLTASYPPREFVVQYQESDLAFVSRLLEHVGVCFFFEHKDGADVLVLSDANSGFGPPVDGKEVPFRSRGERQGVFAIESQTRMTPAQYVVKDYNYRTPQLALQATAPNDKGDGGFVMEYGAHFKNPDEGAVVARIRAEELAASRTILDGKSDRHGFSAGAMVLLEGHPRGDMPLLLTEVHHRASTSALGTGKESARDYENTFKAIPGKTPYRPGRITPKPRIHGVITGVIDAAAKGPYAELDADGRYRVRFLFDAGDAGDGQASRLCRMAQPHGGGGFGMHFPLRSGVEVILTFVEGDPDRPIILGVVPNPQTPSPVTAGNGTRNIIRTGGNNEINIDDTAGAERIKMSTPHGKSVIQLGAPNANEDGIASQSEHNVSTLAKTGWSVIAPIASTVGDAFKVASAWDITQYCTLAVNWTALADAALSAASDGTAAINAMFQMPTAAWVNKIQEKIKESEKEIEQLEGAVGASRMAAAQIPAKEAALAAKQEELAKAQEKASATGSPDDAAKAAQLQQEADGLSGDLEETRVKADAGKSIEADIAARKDQVEVGKAVVEQISKENEGATPGAWAVNYLKKMGDPAWLGTFAGKLGEAGLDPAKQLTSTLSAYTGYAAQVVAGSLAETMAGVAKGIAVLGTAPTSVSLLTPPAFTGGGDSSAALVGGINALVAATYDATLASPGSAGVFGGKHASLKSPLQTEVFGGESMVAGSPGTAKVWGSLNALLESGRYVGINSDGTIELRAGPEGGSSPGTPATISNNVRISAGQKLVVESYDGSDLRANRGPIVGFSKKDTSFTSEEGSIRLDAQKGPSFLEMADSHVILHHKEWGIAVTDQKVVNVGRWDEPEKHLWVKDDEIGMKRGSNTVSLKSNSFNINVGSNPIEMKTGHLVVNGNRIDLG